MGPKFSEGTNDLNQNPVSKATIEGGLRIRSWIRITSNSRSDILENLRGNPVIRIENIGGTGKFHIGKGKRGRGGVHGVENWKNNYPNPKPQEKIEYRNEWRWILRDDLDYKYLRNGKGKIGRRKKVREVKIGGRRISEVRPWERAPTTLSPLYIQSRFRVEDSTPVRVG